ncbi:RNA polymerase sigma factor [Paenibacillus thiaminolyticus]|uniref:RNA polymerase sigma factor n=1 Tax=Paenibacillus thiaminolyticus TaxID=49283 RepID=UPI002543CBEB|nr:sigma-70 family RNA polymerase sigma factor [Paenibacillus thiaminolyticus]WII36599.1 sigma-70 family RNA polymerase sigma factor [Paenibacillus thiaminolyticus]
MHMAEWRPETGTDEEEAEARMDEEGAERPQRDEELVEAARAGSGEAFGELVRRHRERALGWACSMARDDQLAEDIVQEALLNAFLRLETLLDASRFQYWLQRIVRNQANMKLRRGGPYGKERPWSSLAPRRPAQDSELDRVLHRLCTAPPREMQDPQAWLLRRELMEQIRELLSCLTARERQMFEAHVFRQLPPSEIARLFDTSPGSVYTALSRSRTKVQRERIRVYFQDYASEKKKAGRQTRRVLATPLRI